MTGQESMASFLLSMRAKLPQHKYENRAVLFMHRRKACCKALFLQAISELRSHSALVCSFSELSDITEQNVPPPGRGLLAPNPGRRGLRLLGTFGLLLTSRPSFISLGGVTSMAVTLGGGASFLLGHVRKRQFFHGL